jgi:hypothetical protein
MARIPTIDEVEAALLSALHKWAKRPGESMRCLPVQLELDRQGIRGDEFGRALTNLMAKKMVVYDGATMKLLDAGFAIIPEIVAARPPDSQQKTSTSHTASISNQFFGPVGNVAQGGGTINQFTQPSQGSTPIEIAEAIALVLREISLSQATGHDIAEATEKLSTCEPDLRQGRVPFAQLSNAVDVATKMENLTLRAPEVAHAIQNLAHLLGIST